MNLIPSPVSPTSMNWKPIVKISIRGHAAIPSLMRFHDYHLTGYSVRHFGQEVLLHLELGNDLSDIRFSDVAFHHFIHTGAAIITCIYETPLRQLLEEKKELLDEWWRWNGGFAHWDDDVSVWAERLEDAGHRAWLIESAIGFEGFVVGKEVGQMERTADGR